MAEVEKKSVTYEEYNQRRAKTIKALKVKLRVRAPDKETDGNWYKWFKSREKVRQTCETLFAEFDKERSPLDIRNRAAIARIRWTLYPLLLCDLAECYEQTRRFQDAETVLLKARSLGSKGAELLLFALYAEHSGAMGLDDASAAYLLKTAFRRVKEIDVHSEKVVKEIHNASVYANALTLLEKGALAPSVTS
ncbi:MAG: hypothetical protein IKR84_02220 [Oscillibacter sp.]|nr:hypothetical protein [Oscillibacter sp.]